MSVDQYPTRKETVTATIANGASLSGVVDLHGCRLVGVVMPSAWTAAGLTFQGSVDGVNFFKLTGGGGTQVGFSSVVASEFALLSIAQAILYPFAGVRYIKLRSGTDAAPVNQAADRVITVVCVGGD